MALAVAAVFYALGSVVGGVFALRLLQDGDYVLQSFLKQFLLFAQGSELIRPRLLRVGLSSLWWIIAAFALSLSTMGSWGLPILCGMRGFLFSFSVWAFVQVLGKNGLTVAFLLLGVSGLIVIPIFLLLTSQGFLYAKSLSFGGVGQVKTDLACRKRYLQRWIAAVCVLCGGFVAEWYVMPNLLMGVSDILLK